MILKQYLFRAWIHSPNDILDGEMSYRVSILENNTCLIDGDGAPEIDKDPSIKIMQHTGCFDSIGNPIYEGDIVSATHPAKEDYSEYTTHGEVKIRDLFRGAVIQNSKHGINYTLNQYSKVIGNIYENTDLLNKIRKNIKIKE